MMPPHRIYIQLAPTLGAISAWILNEDIDMADLKTRCAAKKPVTEDAMQRIFDAMCDP